MSDVVRTPIRSIVRERRGLEDRLAIAAPRLVRAIARLVARRGPRSRFRRAWMIRAHQLGWEANNRGDDPVQFSLFAPDYDFSFVGDTLTIGPDIEQSYSGHAGVRALLDQWRAGFDSFRFEPRELIDPGHDRIAIRYEQIARTGEMELRREGWAMWWLHDGRVVRQVIYFDEADLLAELERGVR
jgi:hypothetical protein